MNILSIGNSFSQDAHRYIHKIARADKNHFLLWNLYIGGCPLSTHFRNMKSDEEAYVLEVNGEWSALNMSIKKALLATHWDCVTIQQVSSLSTDYDSYQPYLDEVIACVRKYSPKSRIIIHETWGYLADSNSLLNLGYQTHEQMYNDIAIAYKKAAEAIAASAIIPAGYTVKTLLEMGIPSVHRDTKHASDLARFAIGLTWYQALTRRCLADTDFSHFDFDTEHTPEEIEIAKKASIEALRAFGYELR